MGRSTEEEWLALARTATRRRVRPAGWLRRAFRVRAVRVPAVLLGLALLGEGTRRFTLSQSLYRLNLGANADLAELPEPLPGDRILLFAPHPDDEILGAGGYVQRAQAVGARVRVVLLTNGEFSRIAAALTEKSVPRTPGSFLRLGYDRQQETLAALRAIGVPESAVTFLGYPNEYLDQLWSPAHWPFDRPARSARLATDRSPYTNAFTPETPFAGQALLADIQHQLLQVRPTIVLTTHPNDTHNDHWPAYAFVQLALQRLRLAGHPFARDARLLTYLVHRDHWPAPRGFLPLHHLEPPLALSALDGADWRAFPLTLAETLDKRDAIRHFRSQGAPFDKLLNSFARSNELFCVPPAVAWNGTGPSRRAEFQDPVVDINAGVRLPSADIRRVALHVSGTRLTVSVETVGPVSRDIRYQATVHAVRADGTVEIAQYEWNGTRAGGTVWRGGAPRPVSNAQVAAVNGGHLSELRAPLPWNGSPPIVLVRACTLRGNHTIDQTGVVQIPAAGSPKTAGD